MFSEEGARMKQANLDVWNTGERGKNLESECSWAIHGNRLKTETSIQTTRIIITYFGFNEFCSNSNFFRGNSIILLK